MLARVLAGVGRVLLAAGMLVLLFVAYQLWGTNLRTDRAQDALDREFAQLADEYGAAGTPTTTTGTTAPNAATPRRVAPDIPPPAEGDLIGRITIPDIGLRRFNFVQGVTTEQLKRGAGHYPGTPLPGQAGNAAIAGHRTTYGAPFHNVDDLEPGDLMMVETLAQGMFRYEVTETSVVTPEAVEVLDDFGDDRLTLTACHPKFSAEERIIIAARLVGNPVPRLPGQDEAVAASPPAEIDGESSSLTPVVLLALAGAAVGLAAWAVRRFLLGRHRRWVRLLPYLVGTPVFLVVLFFFFESFSALLPASY